MKKRGKRSKAASAWQKKLFYVLLALFILLILLNLAKYRGWLIPRAGEVKVVDNTVYLDSLTLQQKIAQMIITAGFRENLFALKNLQIGGIHLYARENANVFNNTIIDFQYGMSIKLFVTSDLEGCVTPFSYVRNFTAASDVKTIGEAFEKGFREGEFLSNLGFNLNFAPVVDLDDQIWKCRSFPGNEKDIAELAESYVLGLQTQGILATAKHYPGKTLDIKDPHKFIVAADIDDKDLYPYSYLFQKGDVKAVMVSHVIVSGAVDSAGLPAVVSPKIIGDLKKEYGGLIVSDEIHMLGLKNFFNNSDGMYIALFKAGNDVILDFDSDPNELYRMINVVSAAVERGEISEKQIDESVTKILRAKGYDVRS